MLGPHGKDGQSIQEPHSTFAECAGRDEHMEDEEKILANRADANLPALLTRDVLGG